MKGMILAAGRGTRLLPLTESKPKALLEIQGVTLLEHTIRYMKYFGVNEIIINVHHHATQIVDFLKKKNFFGLKIEISDETDALLDTGGGLLKAKWFFDDGKPFFLSASDVITNLDLKGMMNFHEKHGSLVTLAVKHRDSTREFLFDDAWRLCGWKNNMTGETRMARPCPAPLKIAFSTIHIIHPSFFDYITEEGCFSLIDVYLRLASDHVIMGYEHDKDPWFEFGRIENLERLNKTAEIKTLFNRFHHLA